MKPKRKRGVVVTIRRGAMPGFTRLCFFHEAISIGVKHASLRLAGLSPLKPGESRRVRIIVEEK